MAKQPLKLNKDAFAETARERMKQAREFWREWRVAAVDDYAFVSGKQWLDEDEAVLREERRPPITFNYSEKMIDAVVGAEVSNRQEVTYQPRNLENSRAAELWNAAAKWSRENCNAEDEESDAFRDALICGMGWTWTRMDYSQDPEGAIVIERIDPLEMLCDPAASKPGIADRRWNARNYWVDDAEIKRTWPDALPSTVDTDADSTGVVVTGQVYREDGIHDDSKERHKNQSLITLYECYELEPLYRVANGTKMEELNSEAFASVRADIEAAGMPYVKLMKRVYYRAFFAGDTLLEVAQSPSQIGFTFQCITGKRDRNKNYWYGLTRVMKDPQRWANKWLSQILHIINSNAKGGIMAEINAFVDPVKAQEEWAQPNSVTLMNEGAISGGKVMNKPMAQYPAGLDKLMSFALESLPMVTGINLEALGLANRDQAGVLEQQRKQAAYGLLSPMFDALRRYRKEQGHILLHYINEYISDGRMIRIGGMENAQYVPLIRQPGSLQYDIIVDQAPNAPNTKDKTWQALVEIIPAMLKAGTPIPPDVLDYTPLPAALSTKWKEFIGQQQQMNEKMQEQMQKLQQENQQLKSDQTIKQQELDMEGQRMQAKIQMEREAHQQKMALEREKAQGEYELEAFKQDRQQQLAERQAENDARLQKKRAEDEFRVKAFAAGVAQNADGTDVPASERKVSIGIDTSSIAQMLEQTMAQQQQTTQMLAQVMTELTSVLKAPRKLITDASGNPVGSQPVLQ